MSKLKNMKTNKSMPLMVCAVAFTVLSVLTAFTLVNEDLHQAMNKMMQKMKSMKMTGDPDADFAGMMIEHHQGSIDAANIVIKSGKDDKIKSMARKILDSQPQEQMELRKHKDENHDKSHAAKDEGASTSHGSQFSNEMKNLMDEMESEMKNMKMSGDLDRDFATMMIGHHEGAINMTEAEEKHGKVAEVKSIAEKIKSDSQKDISELKNWLSSRDK